jgi:hypothetical protein
MGRLKWSMIHLLPIAKKLGYTPLLFSYSSRHSNISDIAIDLENFIKQKIPENSNLNFLTHSLGSIITQRFLRNNYKYYQNIKTVFLGPPLKGSKVAKFASKYKFFNWYFGSPLMELSDFKQIEIVGYSACVIAGTLSNKYSLSPIYNEPNDTLVGLSETYIDGVYQHHIVRCVHAVLMYHPGVLKIAFNFLKNS